MTQATSSYSPAAISRHSNVSLTVAQAAAWTGQEEDDIRAALAIGDLRSLALPFVDSWGRVTTWLQMASARRALAAA